jgi:hypothetical protein
MIKGNANYFSTKRKKQEACGYQKVKVIFTACTKDLTNPNFPDRNNPEAAWFPENRTDIEPSTFIGYFKNLPAYNQEDMDYFISAICVNSKVNVKLYDQMSDIYDAYLGENYTGIAQFGESSLHGSCMKSEDTSRNAADFYYNFAGAKIIIVRDSEKSILGRAIVWEKVMDENNPDVIVSVIDRIYFSHDFIIKIIRDYAKSIGIRFRKRHNDNSSSNMFVALNDVPELQVSEGSIYENISLKVKVPATQWHKHGAPYMDTFYAICLDGDGKIYLRNCDFNTCIAKCRDTKGYAKKERSICPLCGKLHSSLETICNDCSAIVRVETQFGSLFVGKAIDYKGQKYPDFLFKRGRPIKNLILYLQIEKLYEQVDK